MNKILNSILFTKGIIWQHIESYDFFLKTELKKILNNKDLKLFSPEFIYDLTYSSVKVKNAVFMRKNFEYTITPNECRQRDITYSSHLYANLELRISGKVFFLKNFTICRLPLMLQSKSCILSGKNGSFFRSVKECTVDPGGYFIIRGVEKIILIQEQLSLNRMFTENDLYGNPCVITMTNFKSSRLKNCVVLKNRKLFFRHKIFMEDIPLIVVFRYFRFEENEDLKEIIGKEFENLLRNSLEENKLDNIINREKSILYLTKRIDERFSKKFNQNFTTPLKKQYFKNQEFLAKLIDENILTNINEKKKTKKTLDYEKGIFLTIMIRRLFLAISKSDYTNSKDYYGNKRIELAGDLFGMLFDDFFTKTSKEFKKQLTVIIQRQKKEYLINLNSLFKSDIISNGIEMAFITGNWSIKKYRIERNGVTQVLSRANQLSCLSNLAKIISSCEKTIRGSGPRALNSSQWGLICPSDTPEGESCGLVKSLALLAHVSTKENSIFVKWLLQNLGVYSVISLNLISLKNSKNFSTVFIDGEFIGYHSLPSKLLYTLRFLRRVGLICKFVSISWNSIFKYIYITTDSGRICRPLIIVCSGKIKLKEKEIKFIKKSGFYWKDLIRDGIIEFLDTNEENNAYIASTKEKVSLETTHLEISPMVILGLCVSTIPLCNHNQSPRNTYQCAMGKQSAGVISFNQLERTDTLISVLSYPQKSLVKTKTLNLLGIDRLPSGTNTYVCIMSYSGYDLEDSIILNRESILRGFSRTTVVRKHKILCRDIEFSKNKEILEDLGNWGEKNLSFNNEKEKISESNILEIENNNFQKSKKEKQKKIQCKIRNNWMIKRVLYTNDINGTHFIKLILRQTRKPEIGDKFSSRHGQKGVCGLICPQENLPFSTNGLIPDLIMNPHGFPSRMTIGKLIEIVSGKNSLLRGNFFNGTAFCGKNISEFVKIFWNIGHSSDGKEFLICGLTGEPLKKEVFCGPVYYQRLKHMAKDKIHARSRGARSCLTRQPIEGRSRGGGLRFGEMERDCVVGFGCAELLSERLMLSSDIFLASFDYNTGLMACEENSKQNVKIKLPYACKLLFQELRSMNITPKLNLKNKGSIFTEL